METLFNILIALVAFLIGFLLGSIPNGVIIGKMFFGVDPRKYGSHNSGGTNSGRVFGKKIGIIVIILDILKTVISFWSVWAILRFSGLSQVVSLWDEGNLYCWLAPLGAAFGHCYSPWLRFKGGKAVACFMGMVGGTSWVGFLLCWSAFLPIFHKKKIMSEATLMSGLIIVSAEWFLVLILYLLNGNGSFLMWNFGFGGQTWLGWESALSTTIVYLLMLIRHRQNLLRIKNGTEAPLQWSDKPTVSRKPFDDKNPK